MRVPRQRRGGIIRSGKRSVGTRKPLGRSRARRPQAPFAGRKFRRPCATDHRRRLRAHRPYVTGQRGFALVCVASDRGRRVLTV